MPGRLKIQRPSPTTVSFTVSNAPQRSSSLAKILFALQVLLRAFLFLCVVVVGITLLRHLVFEGDDGFISWPLVWSSTLGSKLCCLVDSYNPLAVAMVSALVIYCVFRRGYTGMLKKIVSMWLCKADEVQQRNHSWLFGDSASRPRHLQPPICLPPPQGLFLPLKSKTLSSMKLSKASRFAFTWQSLSKASRMPWSYFRYVKSRIRHIQANSLTSIRFPNEKF